jgi:anaerobic ribonucleoside-triphosphate reductase activating protein
MKWRLNKIQFPVYNLGPGRRLGIWVQGCDLGCKGCVNQTLWAADGGRNVDVIDLFNWLVGLDEQFDGVTMTGGEPFQQYEPLIAFLHLIKSRTKLDVYCFTGYYLAELNEKFPDKLFSRYVDFLIDGRYVADLHEDSNVRGSSNQTLYQFIDSKPIRASATPSKVCSLKVTADNRIYMAVIPKRDDLNRVSADLARSGIRKEFR